MYKRCSIVGLWLFFLSTFVLAQEKTTITWITDVGFADFDVAQFSNC